MSLIPIKLLKNGVSKNTLLNLKNESSEIDTIDYIESRIETNPQARKLLAIEDASEMAKLYLHKSGLFEKIVRDIKGETGKEFTFQCKKTKAMKVSYQLFFPHPLITLASTHKKMAQSLCIQTWMSCSL